MWEDVCRLLTDPSRIADELARRIDDESKADGLQARISQVESNVTDLQGRIDRIIDAYESGYVEKQEFERRIVPLRARLDREREAIAGLRRDQFDEAEQRDAAAAFAKLAETVRDQLGSASAELKRDLCKLPIKRIEIGREEIRIVYRVPPVPFVRSPESQGFLQHYLESAVIPSGSLPAECSQGKPGWIIRDDVLSLLRSVRNPVGGTSLARG